MPNPSSSSFFGIDLIKVVAILSVVSVHFFLNTSFYSTPVAGTSMIVQAFCRQLFIICVPLFLMATGYLQWKKTFTRTYGKGILNIVLLYVLLSLFVIAMRIWVFEEIKPVGEWISSVFTFDGIRYAWYVEMYIGLALLIPFLNRITELMKGKRDFLLFLGILVFITSVASCWNLVNDAIPYLRVVELPDYWTSLYPVTYYFIGVYFRAYGLEMRRVWAFFGFLVVTGIQTAILVWGSDGGEFRNMIGSYNSVLIVIQATLLFASLYRLERPKILSFPIAIWWVSSVSALTLDIYLLSAITDPFLYSVLFSYVDATQHRLILYAPIVVIGTFSLAFTLALLRRRILPLRNGKPKKP